MIMQEELLLRASVLTLKEILFFNATGLKLSSLTIGDTFLLQFNAAFIADILGLDLFPIHRNMQGDPIINPIFPRDSMKSLIEIM
jgi:hypothetical protein